MKFHIILFAWSFVLVACSSVQKNSDPLQNTKKLIKEGHISLYENGAFQVPSTHLYLIPPGPQALDVATDLLFVKSKASLSKALESAEDSVSVVSIGMKKTFTITGELSEAGTKARDYIQSTMRPSSTLIILKSSKAGHELIGESWNYGKAAGAKVEIAAQNLAVSRKESEQNRIVRKEKVAKKSEELHADSHSSYAQTKVEFSENIDATSRDWILGYATVDKKIEKNVSYYESKKSLERFSKTYKETESNRKETSDTLYYLMNGSFEEADQNGKQSLANARNEMSSGSMENGYTLAAVKSIGWWMKSIVWDYALVPASKVVVGGVGYVLYNGIAYPVVLSTKQGYNTTLLAVEYSQLQLGNGYDYVAPTGQAALAGIIASAKAVAGYSKAGLLKTGAVATDIGGAAGVETLAAVEKSSLYVGEKSVHYVGVPLATAGTTVGVATAGALLTGAGYVGGGITYASGEVAAVGADVTAKASAGVVAVGGSVGSVAAGAAVGVFEVAQSVVVVPTLALGSAITIGYGTASQIAAHAVLGAADAAYLVLSMEGPRFVIYAIKGNVDSAHDLPAGTVVDLDELRRRGEVVKKLPLTDEELKPIVESMTKDLPAKN